MINGMKKFGWLIGVLMAFQVPAQKFDSLALTPPMGWNSWNTFSINIDEKLIKDVANSFVKDGLKDAGYQYIVIDDGWMAKERDAKGSLVADPVKFPNGMKSVVDYVHGKGLKFGIYNCAGSKTCGGFPGSRGHEYQDALLYASWGVDYLKYDWCNTEKLNAEGAYITMRDALYAAGRPMVFSLCEWGENQPWKWGAKVGHLWRTTGDITNCWDCEDNHGTWSSWGVLRTVNMRKDIRQYAGPGHWNDPDMMEVGNGMTVQEDRSHFTLWSMLAAPLIMGNDLRSMKNETREILTNKEVIAVNQDVLGVQALKYTTLDSVEVWVKPLVNNEWAVCFLNLKSKSQVFSFDWQNYSISDEVSKRTLNFKTQAYQLRNLWTKKTAGTTSKTLGASIGSHDVLMLRLSPK